MADATFRMEHNSDGYAAILTSAGTSALVGSVGADVTAKAGKLAYMRHFQGRDRPAVAVFAHRSKYAKVQALANRMLEGAM